MTRIKDALTAWRVFWFLPQDPLAVSLMRVLVGGMLWYTHLIWGLDFQSFFGNVASWQSREFVAALQQGQWCWSFWWWIPDAWMWPTHLGCMLVLTAFWFGLATRITGVLAFLITISYAQRVPLATFGLDQINGISALYLAIAPCGARFSLDALLRDYMVCHPWVRLSQICFYPATPLSSARLATRLFQVHLCVIYLWAGLGKLQGETWWNGEAMWLSAASLEYQSNDLSWVAFFPLLYQSLSIATWVWEVFFCVLIWRVAWRPFMLLMGTIMHLGIGLFMGMWTFGLAMIFVYCAFLDPQTLSNISASMSAWFRRKLPPLNSRISENTPRPAKSGGMITYPEKPEHAVSP
jgi:hypothetical protein